MTMHPRESYIDIPPKKSLFNIGLDNFGQSPLQFYGSEVNTKAQPISISGVHPNVIQSGDLTQRLNMSDGYIQSDNFVTGVSGWRISSDGTSEFH